MVYSLDIFRFLFGTSLLFHGQLLPDFHIDFSRGRSGEGCGEEKNLLHCCGNVNWYSHYGKKHEGPLKTKKKKMELDPTIQIQDIYSEKTVIWKDMCTPLFTAVLFTIAKT